ncbi:hypothetical protein THAOC_10630 [Thalassiosira oceanica]|uniref:Uncharacterized protein n=1 Tax=Thalassiosira oceanica TaxID=159749 RepID=K0SS71_THAOC|nr:hypothetical protein THAOC_10630 [Thalassiosira oceanica]|eukprot:EJK68210.1 hypothetical protein THAOC_10630 [Thalassiosira oceanica]
MGAVIGPPGEAIEELDSPYCRCAGRADRGRRGAQSQPIIGMKTRPREMGQFSPESAARPHAGPFADIWLSYRTPMTRCDNPSMSIGIVFNREVRISHLTVTQMGVPVLPLFWAALCNN